MSVAGAGLPRGVIPRIVPATPPSATVAAAESQTSTLLPAELNLQLYAGDDLTMRFVFKDAAGASVDMTGTWAAHIRAAPIPPEGPEPALLAELVIDSSGAAQGIIVAALLADDTMTLPPTTVWDLQQTVGSLVRTTHRGSITLTPDVTRP